MLSYIGRATTYKFSNQWVSQYSEWELLPSFSDSDHKSNVEVKRVTNIKQCEQCLSYVESMMAISLLETIKYEIFSDIEIVFFLFQTALQHHRWREWLWTWHWQSLRAIALSLRCGINYEFGKWQNKSLIGGNLIEMLWKIDSSVSKLGR